MSLYQVHVCQNSHSPHSELIPALKHIGQVLKKKKIVQQYFRVMHLQYIFDVIQTIPFKTNRISK